MVSYFHINQLAMSDAEDLPVSTVMLYIWVALAGLTLWCGESEAAVSALKGSVFLTKCFPFWLDSLSMGEKKHCSLFGQAKRQFLMLHGELLHFA